MKTDTGILEPMWSDGPKLPTPVTLADLVDHISKEGDYYEDSSDDEALQDGREILMKLSVLTFV